MRWRRRPAGFFRVAVVDGYGRTIGGAHAVARDLARAGTDLGEWTVRVVLPTEGPAATWLRENGVEVDVLGVRGSLTRYGGVRRSATLATVLSLPGAWLRLARAVRGADLLHVHDHRGLVLALPLVLGGRRPVVWHVHNADAVGRVGHALSLLALRVCDVTLVPSGEAAQLPVAGRSRVRELPNAVAVSDSPASPVAGRLVSVGRWHPSKGLDVLIEAVQLLSEAGYDVELVVVGSAVPGEEPYAERLTSLAAQVPGVRLAGPMSRPAELVVTAAVYVQPSRSEPFGLAALEASAAGVPVVASAVGGLTSVVVDRETGLLVEPDDVEALTGALRQLLDDPSCARSMGERGRHRARTEFSFPQFADRLRTAYGIALGRR